MGVKVVQQFGVSEIEGERRQVRNLIVNLPTKVMAENTAMALLVKGPSLQQIGWRSGGGYKTFDLPPHSCRIVSPGENYAVSHIKTNFKCELKFATITKNILSQRYTTYLWHQIYATGYLQFLR